MLVGRDNFSPPFRPSRGQPFHNPVREGLPTIRSQSSSNFPERGFWGPWPTSRYSSHFIFAAGFHVIQD
jgi:hypothetical protein